MSDSRLRAYAAKAGWEWVIPLYTGTKVLPKGINLRNAFVFWGQGDQGPVVNRTVE